MFALHSSRPIPIQDIRGGCFLQDAPARMSHCTCYPVAKAFRITFISMLYTPYTSAFMSLPGRVGSVDDLLFNQPHHCHHGSTRRAFASSCAAHLITAQRSRCEPAVRGLMGHANRAGIAAQCHALIMSQVGTQRHILIQRLRNEFTLNKWNRCATISLCSAA